MHLVRLDIDKKNSASQYHVGPLGAGLNAIFSPLTQNSTLLTRFTKSLLFRGQTLGELDDSEFASIDGSVTWVDASGHLRMVDCVGGKPLIAQMVEASVQAKLQPLCQEDDERVRGIGNMFWEGEEHDSRWDELRADVLGMIFCSPLGSVSPEKLWWAAGKLGVHSTAKTELDEGYKQLKDEETLLLNRLRDSDPVDHDKAWWMSERDRLRTHLQLVHSTNLQRASGTDTSVQPSANPNDWDTNQLSQQLAHAEQMIERWNQRWEWHHRLAQVQSLLQTRSPYRRTSHGSLIPTAERFLSELTAGAVRQLPTWAIETSYLHSESYRAGLRFDLLDSQVPPSETRQRRLVDLAIRLALAQAARSRIGRIPFLLEHSLDGFRGEPLEQILHVVSNFSRDGWQVLLTTADEFIARRIAGHGGTVARVHENLRYAKPQYVIDSDTDLGLHPILDRAPVVQHAGIPIGLESRAFGTGSSPYDYMEVNRQLDSLATEQDWTGQYYQEPTVTHRGGKAYYLSKESAIDAVPGFGAETIRRFRSIGIHRVGDLLSVSLSRLVTVTGLPHDWLQKGLSIVDLMCNVPQMRPFDARVLISCGVKSSKDLAGLDSLVLAKRIQHFLGTDAGRALRRTAERGELGRLKQWLKSIFEQRGIETDLSEAPKDFDWNAIQKKSKPRPSVPISIKTQSNSSWQFHLELGNAVEDAPTIGAKMAEKLSAIQVTTVGDLLAADPTEVAEALSEKGVTSATVETWQNQAMLVCRIPNLRGQDAQLLVAAGYSSAEHVAATDADHLHEAIQGVARSKQGQRFLRGGNPPDRERIQSWIEWSKHSRAVKAA